MLRCHTWVVFRGRASSRQHSSFGLTLLSCALISRSVIIIIIPLQLSLRASVEPTMPFNNSTLDIKCAVYTNIQGFENFVSQCVRNHVMQQVKIYNILFPFYYNMHVGSMLQLIDQMLVDECMRKRRESPRFGFLQEESANDCNFNIDVKQNLLFAHQTAWQKCMNSDYRHEIIVLDATYKTMRYEVCLFFLVVKTWWLDLSKPRMKPQPQKRRHSAYSESGIPTGAQSVS